MNEILLLVLIAFTLLTFISLNRKIGLSAPVPLPVLNVPQREQPWHAPARIIYSGMMKKMQAEYNMLWAINATSSADGQTQEKNNNEITVIYHQTGSKEKLLAYATHHSDHDKDITEVCVISSISDIQYRHVLLPLDFVA